MCHFVVQYHRALKSKALPLTYAIIKKYVDSSSIPLRLHIHPESCFLTLPLCSATSNKDSYSRNPVTTYWIGKIGKQFSLSFSSVIIIASFNNPLPCRRPASLTCLAFLPPFPETQGFLVEDPTCSFLWTFSVTPHWAFLAYPYSFLLLSRRKFFPVSKPGIYLETLPNRKFQWEYTPKIQSRQ